MCGRFTLKTPVANCLADLFPDWQNKSAVDSEIGNLANEVLVARSNIAPTQPVLVVHSDSQGQLTLESMRWGLLPAWADAMSAGYNMINARSETLADKPSFRTSLVDKRCVILADGYYEWKAITPKVKEPYWIHRPDKHVFGMAGLWAENRKIASQNLSVAPSIRSTTIITTQSNADTESVHDRMPAILFTHKQISDWLSPTWNDKKHTDRLLEQLRPCELGQLTLQPVSKELFSTKQN